MVANHFAVDVFDAVTLVDLRRTSFNVDSSNRIQDQIRGS